MAKRKRQQMVFQGMYNSPDDGLPPLPPTHPAIDLFPMCSPELIYDIAENMRRMGGYGDGFPPIYLYEGKIIDGRARWLACVIAGVAPEIEVCDPSKSPYALAWSLNGLRYHFKPDQKAFIAVAARWRLTVKYTKAY